MKKFKIILIALFLLLVTLLLTSSVNAETMSAEFKSYLNEEGKFVVNSIKPTNEDEFWSIFETLYLDANKGNFSIMAENPNSDYTSATVTYHPGTDKAESHTVELAYEYDADIKTIVDEYKKKIPEDKEFFDVTDMEVINYIYNGKGDVLNLIKYSGELKKYINYKNFSIDVRMGCDDKFFTEAAGIASFTYNNTFYGMLSGPRGASAKHIIYVPDSTGDTKEELMRAAQKRIDDYIGKNKVTLSYLGTGIYDLYMDEYETSLEEAQKKLTEVTKLLATLTENTQEWQIAHMNKIDYEREVSKCQYDINSFKQQWENGSYTFLKEAEGDFYFNAKVFAGTKNETDYNFIIVKNSSKMVNPVVKTTDVKTDITITPADNSIPLDTIIKAEKLTSGTEYEKVIKTLDVENHETFDLTLYSNSISKNIKTGKFEVKIPVSDTLKDKTLIAYYVGADNKVEEHEVTVKDGYATFTTDHFSIYTLAEKKVVDETPDSTPTIKDETPDSTPTTKGEKDETPKTGAVDITEIVLVVTIISALGIVVLNKKETK